MIDWLSVLTHSIAALCGVGLGVVRFGPKVEVARKALVDALTYMKRQEKSKQNLWEFLHLMWVLDPEMREQRPTQWQNAVRLLKEECPHDYHQYLVELEALDTLHGMDMDIRYRM